MIRNYSRPFPASVIYPDAVYSIKGRGRKLYLTFDDGPDPDSTPLILDILHTYGAKATFFCTGSKVVAAPALFARIASEGHLVGNHGFSHLNGLKTPVRTYCADVFRGRDITCSNIFRPPYGRIRMRQYRILERSMQIFFWGLMPYDFDQSLTAVESYSVLTHRLRAGSVIVLHDKPASTVLKYLDRFLEKAQSDGWTFVTVDDYSGRS